MGKLRLLGAYKAEMRGGRVILVNPSGTSQKRSGCGEIVPKDLSTRKHVCPRCGLVIDRDVNAAKNILKLGLEQARLEAGSLLSGEEDKQIWPMKQETRMLQMWAVHSLLSPARPILAASPTPERTVL